MTLSRAFELQAESCDALGSPFMSDLMRFLAKTWPETSALGQKCLTWPEQDLGPSGASLPLRLAGGLHALVLRGDVPELAKLYPPHPRSKQELGAAVLDALVAHEAFLLKWIERPPQTNEVRRSAALILAGHWLGTRFAMPLVTSELGASAGLNLNWDRYALATPAGRLGPADPVLTLSPTWEGPLPAPTPVKVSERRGVDLDPPDVQNPEDRLRLMAYLWPDQPERAALTRAAMAAQTAPVARGDAIPWLRTRLQNIPTGHLHLIYHTIAWQYFPADIAAQGQALIEKAGQHATASAPLAWLAMEADGRAPGAALTLRLWPGDTRHHLARVDFHGRWIKAHRV